MENYRDRKPVHISPMVLKEYKDYCKLHALKMGYTLDKIIVEYINRQK